MSVERYEWSDGQDTLGWRLIVNGSAFGRVVWRQKLFQAQKIVYVEDDYGYRRTCFHTLMSTPDADEAYDYLLSLARLKCSAT